MYISMLTNEMATPLSLSSYDSEFNRVYSISEWFDQWLIILDDHELVNNQLEDFAELCGGVECIKKDFSV